MIIESVLDVVFTVFNFLTSPINIPEFPEGVFYYMNQFLEYLSVGVSFVATYTHYPFLVTLLGIIIAIDIAISLYKLVMFVLKKIPFLNIS